MPTTWRATLAHLLLGGAMAITLILATAATLGIGGRWVAPMSWVVVLLLTSGSLAAWRHHVAGEQLRRSLGICLTHRLRTSLAHVQAFNEMLLVQPDVSVDQRQAWLEVVGREAQRLGTAVENLLYLLHDRHSRTCPIRRPIDLGMLLEDAAAAYSAAPGPAHCLELDPPKGIIVCGDPSALRQALDNLFERASDVAAAEARIWATASSDGSIARVVLAFDVERLAPRPRAAAGTYPTDSGLERDARIGYGLELAVVRHVARSHGGRATFLQERGRADYTFELPLAAA